MAVYGYLRVSTLTQAKEGESLEAQRLQVTSYAVSKGLQLPEENVYVEAGVSGGSEFKSVQRALSSSKSSPKGTWSSSLN